LKKIKTRLIMIVVAGSLVCLNGCRNKEVPAEVAVESITSTENIAPVESITSTEGITPTGKTAEEETLTAPIPSEEAADTVSSETESAAQEKSELPAAFPLDFRFSSGAGAWYTVITLNQDGSFIGEYCDSDMGDSGEAYPHGKEYICNFSGRFDPVVQIDENTYSMTLSEITTEKESGEEWIEDGILHIASNPYGLEEGTEYRLYLPETGKEGLPEDFLSWYPGWNFADADGNLPDTLSCFGIYNVKMGYGFFAY
jgi:hypothetical protein